MVFQTTTGTGPDATVQSFVHDRTDGSTVALLAPADASAGDAYHPAISGDGCVVSFSTLSAVVVEPADAEPSPQDDATTTTSSTTTTSTVAVPAGDASPADVADDPPGDAIPPVDGDGGDGDAPDDGAPVSDPAAGAGGPDAQGLLAAPAVALQQAPSPSSTLWAVDRCTPPSTPAAVVTVDRSTPLPAAALDGEGRVIAVSTTDAVRRLVRTEAGWVQDAAFDADLEPGESTTGPVVDISAAGDVIVYEVDVPADPAVVDDTPSSAVHAWVGPDSASVRRLATSSSDPTVSADGRLFAFRSAPGSDTTFQGVVLQTTGPDAVNISIDPLGSSPDLSADGNHVVYDTTTGATAGRVAMTSWIGDSDEPFSSVAVVDLSQLSGAVTSTDSGPVVSGLGDAVSVDPAGDESDVSILTVGARLRIGAPSFDIGVGVIGDVLSQRILITNTGPASLGLVEGSVVVEAPFEVDAYDCVGALRPAASCAIVVSYTVDAYEDVVGSFTVTATNGATAGAGLEALGSLVTPSAPSTSTTTTSTTPPNTTPRSPANPGRPTVTPRRTTTFIPRTTTFRPRTTQRTTTRSTTAGNQNGGTPRPGVPSPVTTAPRTPALSPTSFEFAPTIAAAGRRTASIELTNPGSSSVTFTDASFADPDSGFRVVGSDCTTLAPGATCTVELSFEPVSTGAASSELTVTFSSGEVARATVTGLGAPPPVLAAIPDVATVGQVVTVQGSGFPAGSTVELVYDGDPPRDVVVNDAGVFNLPLVILPNTLPGPLTVLVTGQDDRFGDVEVEMVVTLTGRRNNSSVLGSLGADVGR